MTTLLEELGHRKEKARPVKPLDATAAAAGVGLAIGVLLMVVLCLAMKMA